MGRLKLKPLVASLIIGLSALHVSTANAETDPGVEEVNVQKVKQALHKSDAMEIASERGELRDTVSPVDDLRIENGVLNAETLFGTISVSHSLNGEYKEIEPGFSADGNTVLHWDESSQTVAGFELLRPRDTVSEWNVELPENTSLQIADDSEIDLIYSDPEGEVLRVDGFIGEPWAVTADNKPVKTWYEVQEGKIVQKFESVDEEVVADPRLTFGVGVYLNMYAYEVEPLARLLAGAGIAATAGVCSFDDKLPSFWGRVARILCQAMPFATFSTFKDVIIAPPIFNRNDCLQTRLGSGEWVKVKEAGNCKP